MSDIVRAEDRCNFSLYGEEALDSIIYFASISGVNKIRLDGNKVHKDMLSLLSDLGYIVIGKSGDTEVTIRW